MLGGIIYVAAIVVVICLVVKSLKKSNQDTNTTNENQPKKNRPNAFYKDELQKNGEDYYHRTVISDEDFKVDPRRYVLYGGGYATVKSNILSVAKENQKVTLKKHDSGLYAKCYVLDDKYIGYISIGDNLFCQSLKKNINQYEGYIESIDTTGITPKVTVVLFEKSRNPKGKSEDSECVKKKELSPVVAAKTEIIKHEINTYGNKVEKDKSLQMADHPDRTINDTVVVTPTAAINPTEISTPKVSVDLGGYKNDIVEKKNSYSDIDVIKTSTSKSVFDEYQSLVQPVETHEEKEPDHDDTHVAMEKNLDGFISCLDATEKEALKSVAHDMYPSQSITIIAMRGRSTPAQIANSINKKGLTHLGYEIFSGAPEKFVLSEQAKDDINQNF